MKNRTFQYTAVLLILLALAGCAMPTPPVSGMPADTVTPISLTPMATIAATAPPATADALENTSWQLVSFGAPGAETPIVPGSTVTLAFDAEGQAVGEGGCNSFGGRYQVQDDTLSLQNIVSILRACADEQVMQQEQQYLQALQSAGRFEFAGDRLTIWVGDGSNVLNFVQASSATAEPTSVRPTAPPSAMSTDAERVVFEPGATSASRSGALPEGGVKEYVLAAAAGQTMHVQTIGYGAPVNFTLRSPGGATWAGELQGSEVYIFAAQVVLPEDGDYGVTLSAPENAGATRYDVTFTINATTPPTMPPSPSEPPVRVEFEPGAISAQRDGLLPTGPGVTQYVLAAAAGQTMTVELASDDVLLSLTIESPSGVNWIPEPAFGEEFRTSLTLTLPETGDYLVTLTKPDHSPSTNYEVTFTIQ